MDTKAGIAAINSSAETNAIETSAGVSTIDSLPRNNAINRLADVTPIDSSAGVTTTDSSAVWQRNWRRVASTHSLQDLLEADAAPDPSAPVSGKLVAVGVACVLVGCFFLVGMPFWLVGSKLLPMADSPGFLAWVQGDEYYGPVIVLTVPVTLAAVFLHWLALKLFKHNY